MRFERALPSIGLILAATVAVAASSSGDIVEKREVRETIPVERADELLVDLFHGSIRLTGAGGDAIKMTLHETIRAEDRGELETARREVSLRLGRQGGKVTICADGPFKDPDDCTEWARNSRYDPGYTVVHDLELEVPRWMALDVSSIFGDIDVSGMSGGLDVRGVDGDVRVTEVSGSGRVQNVNGPVRVTFSKNPDGDCEFGTINGDVDVGFEPGLSADLGFKTMTGEALTDFDYTILPPEPLRVETGGDRTVYRMESRPRIRIGNGGPRLRFENINGDILIRKNK